MGPGLTGTVAARPDFPPSAESQQGRRHAAEQRGPPGGRMDALPACALVSRGISSVLPRFVLLEGPKLSCLPSCSGRSRFLFEMRWFDLPAGEILVPQ